MENYELRVNNQRLLETLDSRFLIILGGIVSLYDRQLWLRQRLAAPIALVWTDNRSSILFAKGNAATGYRLRLHHMFRYAPDAIWHALIAYLADTDAAARDTLQTYIQRQQHLIRPAPKRQSRSLLVQPQGRYHDLTVIYGELNQAYFANRVRARITWMRRPLQRPRTSIRFGAYDDSRRLIRISRLLDQPFVPQYVVASVVFHEMLHQLIPRQRMNGRWSVHPPAFRRQERQFPHYQRAKQWQRQHLARLLHD